MKRPTRGILAATLAALSLALSCSSLQSRPEANAGTDDQAIYGQLEMLNVTTTPAIETLTFRGTFRNQFEDPVDGIRVVLRVLQEPSPTSPELVRAQKVLDSHLEPGAHVPFEITARVRPASLANVGFFLNGFAVRRGGEELPTSPLWQ